MITDVHFVAADVVRNQKQSDSVDSTPGLHGAGDAGSELRRRVAGEMVQR